MNNEFNNIYLIHKGDERLKKYAFKGKTEIELNKQKVLTDLILSFYKKVYNNEVSKVSTDMFYYDLLKYGYNLDDGYYIIYGGRHGYYELVVFKDNIDGIFINTIESIIEKHSSDNIYHNKASINEEYIKRFGNINNIWQIYNIEYILDKWNKYYDGNIPQELLDKYLNKINIDNMLVSYDMVKKEITLSKQIKIKSLKKD